MKQILLNLLSSGVKFPDRGSHISVAVTLCPDHGVSLGVTDDGMGTPTDSNAHILEPFEQAGSILTRRWEGIGFGLPIVTRLVDLHGGKMIIEPVEHEGAAEQIHLPLERTMGEGRARPADDDAVAENKGLPPAISV